MFASKSGRYLTLLLVVMLVIGLSLLDWSWVDTRLGSWIMVAVGDPLGGCALLFWIIQRRG